MNILITSSLNHGFHQNGLQQNIIFLAELLSDIGLHVTLLINHSIDECIVHPANILIIEQDEIQDYKFDYILNAAFFIRGKDLKLAKEKNPSLQNVHIEYGNRMIADIENAQSSKFRMIHENVDQVWISPHYKIAIPYYKTLYHTQNVFILPYIWTPKYIEDKEPIRVDHDSINVAVLEPNISITKSSLIPILIAEELNEFRGNSFDRLFVYCSNKLNQSKYFRCWMWNLNLEKKNKIIFQSRENINNIIPQKCQVILSHQLMNELNYIYLEAIYLGIPVVHNSEALKDVGFYYPDYDTQQGAKALSFAIDSYKQNYDLTDNKKILYQFSPKNPYIIEQYKKLFKCN